MGSVSNRAKKAGIQDTDKKENAIPEKKGKTVEADGPIHIHGSPYKVITTCDVLDIRAGAGMDYKIVGQIRETAADKKIYTIIEIKNGWGRLSDGESWIALAYTKQAANKADLGILNHKGKFADKKLIAL